MEPIMSYHLQAMSIGFLVDEETPMIWRGPDGHPRRSNSCSARNQLAGPRLSDHRPAAGTGDIQLTLAQKVPVTGAVIVTPRRTSRWLDARKGLKMFEKVEIPVMGIVENMSTTSARSAAHEEHILARRRPAHGEENDVDFIGSIPSTSASASRRWRQADGRGRIRTGGLAQIYRTSRGAWPASCPSRRRIQFQVPGHRDPEYIKEFGLR